MPPPDDVAARPREPLAVVLVHSPLVGPATWRPVSEVLKRRGIAAVLPDLDGDEGQGEPFWVQHAGAAARSMRALGRGQVPVLVGHSGAGPLLPEIRKSADRAVGGYVFVDAGLPDSTRPRKGDAPFAGLIDRLYAAGARFPDWTDESLRPLVPDPEQRRALLADLRPQPLSFWNEIPPVFDEWPDAPCGYLRFVPNPAYDEPAAAARRAGWPYRELVGGHFHMLVDPTAVADAIVRLTADMRLALT